VRFTDAHSPSALCTPTRYGLLIRRPEDLDAYVWPDPANDSWYADIPPRLSARPDVLSVYRIGSGSAIQGGQNAGGE
jgi:hypothetical protein